MLDQEKLFSLIESGKVEGFSSIPIKVETVISRVYIFEAEQKVIKLYKRDCTWWNENMSDISKGEKRISFITNDFAFNNFLNPIVYTAISKLTINEDFVEFSNIGDADELAIIMKKEDFSLVLTEVLWESKIQKNEIFSLGKQFTTKKLATPASFLPINSKNWYEQMIDRLDDLNQWYESEDSFPVELGNRGLEYLSKITEIHKQEFSKLQTKDLAVLVDCNSENLIFRNGQLSFVDAFSPKDEWRSGLFDIDVYRIATDIFASSGKEFYQEFLRGVKSVNETTLHVGLEDYFIIYSALISAPYFYMLGKKNPKYIQIAEKYTTFLQDKVDNI
jgi:aminoglycoside phosphotransferase family enzyme